MDTSGLASSLSLAAFLAVFAYLSLVNSALSPGNASPRPSEHPSRLFLALRLFRLASVVAIVLSAQALVLSQLAPSVGLIAASALALLAFLVITDGVAKLLFARHPIPVSRLTWPLQASLSLLLNSPKPEERPPGESETGNGAGYDLEGREPPDTAPVVITEEEQARLDPRERLMIRSILRLDDSTAREIMVPRVDIVAVESDTPLTGVASRMLESGHSHLPVYSETIDNVVGVVHSRDLLAFLGKGEENPSLDKIIRPAFFIPESKRLDELLRELQEKRIQMAMVVDEYGGIEGLVALEDLLEEIVGEIESEFSPSLEPRVVPLGDGDIMVDARVSLDDLSELLSTPIGNEDVDTIGGLVYSALGKVPQVGDEVLYNGLRIEVVSLLGRRIRKLKMSRTEKQESQ